ncbi:MULTISPECIES: type II secretion system protein N [unclassified Thioalkalivibrio]|uniref:type II secretion system protein N n=1 Tax=unclassified Thioalkalivibrio TaxID=2621013 RepID=UPI00037C1CC5|nr:MULTISPECIES: type II secretion system protein N [unclassified Thioalkalivibrio]
MNTGRDNQAAQRQGYRAPWFSLGVFFVLALLVALVARLPASVVLAAAERWAGLPDSIAWEQVHGSVWRGSANGLQSRVGPMGHLQWEIRPGEWLRGGLATDLHWLPPGGGELRGVLRVTPGSLQLSGLEGSLPAAALHQWDTGIPLVLDGRLLASDLQFRILRDGSVEHASGRVNWQQAAAGFPRPLPLGEQRATLRVGDGLLGIELDASPEAELAIIGNLRLDLRTNPPGMDAQVRLGPRDHADDSIKRLLENNLRRDDQGRYLWTAGSTP